MSTKIYDAYQWKEINQHHSLMIFLKDVRKKYHEHLGKFFLEIDEVKESFLKLEKNKYTWLKHWEEIIKKDCRSKMAYELYGFDANCVVYLYQHNIYVQFFNCRKPRLVDLIKSPHLIDFHYQDQTDKPENITDYEWGQRRIEWKKIFQDYTLTPKEAGLTYTFFDENDVWSFLWNLPNPNVEGMQLQEAEQNTGESSTINP